MTYSLSFSYLAVWTGLEPATPCVTGRYSNQLNYHTNMLHRAIRHLEKGRVVIFGAGAGLPYFSTDTVSAQRALETHCDELLVGKNGVDGVYTADPRTDPDAKLLDHLTYARALAEGLKVVDASAFALCRDNGLTMRVFGMGEPGNITRALLGEKIGTLVTAV